MTSLPTPSRLFSQFLAALSLVALLLGTSQPAMAGETLDAIRHAGTISCAVVTDVDDYSEADTHGDLSALGADF
jgi:hypothetical protein